MSYQLFTVSKQVSNLKVILVELLVTTDFDLSDSHRFYKVNVDLYKCVFFSAILEENKT